MKRLKRALALLMSSIVIFSVGCGDNTDEKDNNNQNTATPEKGVNATLDFDYKLDHGIHEYKAKTTDKKLVKNETTEYKIVFAEEHNIFDVAGLEDLQFFFKEATDIEMPVISDKNLNYSENNKYLCLGKVSFLENAGITVDSDLGLSGFKVETVGNSVYMVGGQYGTTYAVYEFLRWTFGYEYFGDNCYTLDRNVKNANLIDFKIKDVPDIQLTDIGTGNADYSVENIRRLRVTSGNVIMPIGGMHHNVFEFISPKTCDPDFFSATDGEQLCYTARGNEEKLSLMRDTAFESIIGYLQKDLTTPSMEFTQRDVNTWCNCSACTELKEKYGTDAASQILFINPVAERVQKWIDENQPGRDFTILLFAYQKTVDAPVTGTEGNYAPVDDKVICTDNVGIYYAPIEGDFIKDFNQPVNYGPKTNFEKWSILTKKLFFWAYSVFSANYFIPINTYDAIQQIYQHAYECNTFYIFDQGTYNSARATGWIYLKDYVNSRLMWNVHDNVNDLINNFFANFYGTVGNEMLEIFNSYRVWWKYIETEMEWGGAGGTVSDIPCKIDFWPYGILNNWVNMYDAVLGKIAPLEEVNKEQYEKISDRIKLEALGAKYLLVSFHGAKIASDIKTVMVDEICSIIDKQNVGQMSELSTTDGMRERLLG